ncbi:MAG: GrpB family protein, partial [Oscillospiraceae bacterium]|nr:GrpB family protein [Oscillospiraceae bacterium]
MLGVERYKVALIPHDDNWAHEYEITKTELLEILGDNIIEIRHVGSTAIKGIVAKPILDIAVVVKSIEAINFAGMETAGYEYVGNRFDTGKYLFVRRTNDNLSTHHIGCYLEDNEDYNSTVVFCKYLNEHPEYAKQYNDLKL